MKYLICENGKKVKVVKWMGLEGVRGGHIRVCSLKKPFINADHIYVSMGRTFFPKEKNRDVTGFSLNDREALVLADMLIFIVQSRMNKRRRNIK